MADASDDDCMFYTSDALDHGLLHLRFSLHGDAVDVNVLGARVGYVDEHAHTGKHRNTHTDTHTTSSLDPFVIPTLNVSTLVINLVNLGMGTNKALVVSNDNMTLNGSESVTDQSWGIGSEGSSMQSLGCNRRNGRRFSQVSIGSVGSAGEAVYSDLNTHAHIYSNSARNRSHSVLAYNDNTQIDSSKAQAEYYAAQVDTAVVGGDQSASVCTSTQPHTKAAEGANAGASTTDALSHDQLDTSAGIQDHKAPGARHNTHADAAKHVSDYTLTRISSKVHAHEQTPSSSGEGTARAVDHDDNAAQRQQEARGVDSASLHLECSFWVCVFLDRSPGEQPMSTCQSICRPMAVPVAAREHGYTTGSFRSRKRRDSMVSGSSSRGTDNSFSSLPLHTLTQGDVDTTNTHALAVMLPQQGLASHANGLQRRHSMYSTESGASDIPSAHESHDHAAYNGFRNDTSTTTTTTTTTTSVHNINVSTESMHTPQHGRTGGKLEAYGYTHAARSRSHSRNPPASKFGVGGNVPMEVRYEYRPTWHSVIRLELGNEKDTHVVSGVRNNADTHTGIGRGGQRLCGSDCDGACGDPHKHIQTWIGKPRPNVKPRTKAKVKANSLKETKSASLARSGTPHTRTRAQLTRTLTQTGTTTSTRKASVTVGGGGGTPLRATNSSHDIAHTQDALDLLWLHGIKVVAVLMRNSRAVGQVAIPVKNLAAGDAWFALDPVSAKNLHIAKRGRRKHTRARLATRLFAREGDNHAQTPDGFGDTGQRGGPHRDGWMENPGSRSMLRAEDHSPRARRWCDSVGCCGFIGRWWDRRAHVREKGRQTQLDEGDAGKVRNPNRGRKVASFRTLWLTNTFLALFSVLVVTTLLMSKYALQELEMGARTVSEQLWINIDINLLTEFSFPEQTTVLSGSYFLAPQVALDNAELITNFLVAVEKEVLSLPTVNVSTLFVGSPLNTFYGAGFTVHDGTVRRQALVQDITQTGLRGYAVDEECEALEETHGCSVYDNSEMLLYIPFLNVTERPWYTDVDNTLGLSWTPVYPYAAGNLGITCSYRVPQDLDTAAKAVVAADVLLDDLSAVLASFKYFDSGYSVLFEMENGLLVASSLTTPGTDGFAVTETRTCLSAFEWDSEDATVLDRKRLYLSEDARLKALSDFLVDLCNTECVCYLQFTEVPPITDNCPLPHTYGYANCAGQPANSTYACQPTPPLNPRCTNSTPLFNEGIPHQYTLPNEDILSIGLVQLVNGRFVSAVIVPRSDFTGAYSRVLRWTAAVAVCILLLSMVFALVVVDRVTKEFAVCTKQLARFATLDFSRPVTQNSGAGVNNPIKEIAMVYEVMQSLRHSLRSFSKYVPPDVVRILIHSGMEATLGGQRKKVITVFFSDIVDFTTISENLEIEVLNRVLGDYLQEMSSIIAQNGGTVDKYIGDAIMAIWNAPEIVVDHAGRCCEAALLCQAALLGLRQRWERERCEDRLIDHARACRCESIQITVCSGNDTCMCGGSACAQVDTDPNKSDDTSDGGDAHVDVSVTFNKLGRRTDGGASGKAKLLERRGVEGIEGEIAIVGETGSNSESEEGDRRDGDDEEADPDVDFNVDTRTNEDIATQKDAMESGTPIAGPGRKGLKCRCGAKPRGTSQRRKSCVLPQLYQRIGIHTGPAVVGNFGSQDRLQYTAIGNTVNVGEHLEGLNKKYGTEILISGETYALVCSRFVCRPIDDVYYTDTSGLVRVYELIAHRDTATLQQVMKADMYTRAFEALFDHSDLEGAAELFTQYCDLYCSSPRYGKSFGSESDVALRHLETCKALMRMPES